MKKFIFTILIITLSMNTYAQINRSFKVDGVCGMCKERIETVALEFDFVSSANWNREDKILHLELKEKRDTDKIQKKIAKVGHDTEKYKATDQAYDELPMCCHYREPDTHEHSNIIHGRVYEQDFEGNKVPLYGANIHWEGTHKGTATGKHGTFSLTKAYESNRMTISYAGYESKTVEVGEEDFVFFLFDENKMLEEVVVTYREKTTTISFLSALKIQEMGEEELHKAACCNLSESFETNPSVDVNSTDAITGTRQIELLGLAGSYAQITRENMPDTRGLSTLYGLTYTPGVWIESIQLNTGAGSVINGFESITGQINVELKKPENSEKLFINTYANAKGRLEANVNYAQKINDNWSTGFLLHGSSNKVRYDKNEDDFLDAPIGDNIVLLNRWKYNGSNKVEAQFGVKAIFVNKQGGQLDYYKSNPDTNLWASINSTERYEAWMKMGKIIDETASVGLQLSGVYHDQKSSFGTRNYDATQTSFYANSIYQKSFYEKHTIKTGLSVLYDNYDEYVVANNYLREELVYGVFGEYTYIFEDKFTAVVGLRIDKHNNYGVFFTPRLNLRYAFSEKSVVRASVGRGQKTASIFSENIGAFASSRVFVISGDGSDKPYGLDAEVAWNYGLSFSQEVTINHRPFVVNVDYFYTDFTNQVIVDYDANTQEVAFYNLDGKSYSHSIQFQGDVELTDHFDVRLAYRFNDVRSTYSNIMLDKPLVAKHRAFVNFAYNTESNWKFDATLSWVGSKRLPNTLSNPVEYQTSKNSPTYFQVNGQISKSWFSKKLDTYVGVENLLDYRQEDAIISANNPQSQYFDASMIWGPVFGRNIYVGLRYKIE